MRQLILGQGGTGKTRAEAPPVLHGDEEAERLLSSFGAENHQNEFDLGRGLLRGRCAALYCQHSRVGMVELLWVYRSAALL